MTSSMIIGERRWASARRGGMTSLGKVAVPKPINLPSQKLENHGLDPNVEIVPKGTVSWGSRSSSSSSNPWGSSTLSPKADGSSGSPSHLSGRPSSGGSGTRPSTGSSDRAHEPIANAWSSNSRPSSASGVLTSNQTSTTSLRPRSAETRPGSSQLSRFAEPLFENLGAWGTAGTAEILEVASSKNDGFSLASGDFPTLGSEKENAGKNMESQDLSSHGRPSSSGGVTSVKDRIGTSVAGEVSVNANVTSEAANTWRRDNNPYGEDRVRPCVEMWQADPQGPHPYPNAGISHQHYEAWHGPPINHPGGVWYRGPPGPPPGPPFGSPVPHGGFRMEPFHFYRPQIPATALASPQAVPPQGVGPRAHHPKNGDMHRPLMPDAYMRAGMPMRPGFYSGPVVYEGHHGPPMGYRDSNERDVPFMGMAAGPYSYNRNSDQSARDAGNSHSRSSACGPNGKASLSELVEPGHSHDARGPYRVLLKQQDGWEGENKEQKSKESVTATALHVEKGDQQKLSWESDRREDYKKNEHMGLKRKGFGEDASDQVFDHEGGSSSVPVKVKSSENMGNAKVVGDFSVKVEHATAFPEIQAAPKDSSLIQKIEGLNVKARASDGRHDFIMSVSSREEQKNTSQVVIADSGEATTGTVRVGKNHATGTKNPAAYEGSVAARDKSFKSRAASGPVISRSSTHGMHGRTDHHGKERFSSLEVDGGRRKSLCAESSTDLSAAHSESRTTLIQDHQAKEITEKSEFYPQGNDGGESLPSMIEPSDSQAQCAQMRELAKQRVEQRQKEKQERASDQEAKQLAKLEELNRRTKVGEVLTQKSEVVANVSILDKQEEFQSMAESTIVASKSGTSSSALVSRSTAAAQISESGSTRFENSAVLSNEKLPEGPKSGLKESFRMHKHNESVSVKHDVNDSDDGGASKQKRLSYKQKQNIPVEKISTEKISTGGTEALKGYSDLIVDVAACSEVIANQIAHSCESSPPVPKVIAESSLSQRRRNIRGGKKHKVESSSGATLPSMVSAETIILNNTNAERGQTKDFESEVDASSVQQPIDSKNRSQSSELRLSSPSKENHVRANNQWKSQHSRRMARSVQSNKSAEKFHTTEAVVWAPVRTQKKAEVSDEPIHKSVVEASSVKSDNQMQNNSRNKRAEMERYIPKPVAKEIAQQNSSQQQLGAPSIGKTLSDEIDVKVDSGSQGVEGSHPFESASGKKGVVMESKNWDHRQNKQGKAHGSWRQRASSESTAVQDLQDAQPSNACRNIQKLVEHQQTQKPEVSSVKEQSKYSDDWNMLENPESAVPPNVPVDKDQGVTARGKRHQFKAHKGTGNNHGHDHKKTDSGEVDKACGQSSVPVTEASQTNLSFSKENRTTGDRSTSHWQPKSQVYVTSNCGSRPNSGQNVGADVCGSNRKDSGQQGGLPIPPQPGMVTSEGVAQPHHGQSASVISKVEASSNVGRQEPKRERKIASAKGRPNSPNQGPCCLAENAASSNVDIQIEQSMPSGARTNGNQNTRFNRGHESRGDWSEHNQLINRERQRHNAHYEYQPVGPYINNRANNYDRQKDAPNNGGGKYRQRGQSHSRRGGGNYQGRSSGIVRADGYD